MIKELLKARIPAIFVRTSEEIRVEDILAEALQEVYPDLEVSILSWNPIRTKYYSSEADEWLDVKPQKEFNDLLEYQALLKISRSEQRQTKANIFVFHGIKYLLDSHIKGLSYESIYKTIELLTNVKKSGDTLIFVGSHLSLPDEISKLFYVYDMPLPTAHEIEDVFKSITMEYVSSLQDKNNMKILMSKVPKAAQLSQGLTLAEAENSFIRSLQINNDIDFGMLIKHKAAAVAQSDVLEIVDISKFPMKNVIGFTALKEWLELRSMAFTPKAKKYKLETPKGIILVGHSGTGKSMISKAIGNYLDLPVVRFDFSRVFRSLVGDSEELMEKTLSILNAIGKCVCWIDEINLSMAGASSTSVNDSGVMLKLLQMFLTWSQERKEDVFIVATANSIDTLPPMLYRKGRMDGIWFCGLPNKENRQELFKTHLSLKKLKIKNINTAILSENTAQFSGAEIEHTINDSMFIAASKDEELKTEHILEAVKMVKPNAKFLGESFKQMTNQFQRIGVIDAETGLPVGI